MNMAVLSGNIPDATRILNSNNICKTIKISVNMICLVVCYLFVICYTARVVHMRNTTWINDSRARNVMNERPSPCVDIAMF